MFGDWLLNVAAHFAGFTAPQLEKIEKALPATHKFVQLIVKAQPLIQEMVPLINQALPIINEATTELQSIGPALEILLDVVERDVASGKSRDDAIKNIHNVLSGLEAR